MAEGQRLACLERGGIEMPDNRERKDGYSSDDLQKGYKSEQLPLPVVKPPKEGSGSTTGTGDKGKSTDDRHLEE